MTSSDALKNTDSGLFVQDFEIDELVKSPIFKCFLKIVDINEAEDKIKVVDFRNEDAGYVTLPSRCLFKLNLDDGLLEALYGKIPTNRDKT